MRSWKLWDWIAYIAFVISAVVLATDASLKGSSLKSSFDWLLTSPAWNFAPIVFISVGTVSFLIRDGSMPFLLKGAEARNRQQSALSDAIIISALNDTPPSFRGRFQRPGKSAAFYLEYEFYPLGVMGGPSWSGQRKFQIHEVNRFTVNQWVRFPLMSCCPAMDGARIWSFGSGQFTNDEPILSRALYRGRITICDENDVEENVYFIMKCDGDAVPEVTGQHVFDHLIKWEGRTLEGRPGSLMT